MKALLVGGNDATGVYVASGLQQRGFQTTTLYDAAQPLQEMPPSTHIQADPRSFAALETVLGATTFDVICCLNGNLGNAARLFAGRCDRLLAVSSLCAQTASPQPARPRRLAILYGEDAAATAIDAADARDVLPDNIVTLEQSILAEHHRGAYNATLFRYPSVYGPHQRQSIEASIVRRALAKRPYILIPSEGLGIVSRCAAANAAHCLLLALDRPQSGGEIFNCADDTQYSLGQWVELILDRLGSSAKIIGLPKALNWAVAHLTVPQGNHGGHALMSTAKAKRILGYADVVAPPTALASTVDWWQAQGPGSTDLENDRCDYAMEDWVKQLWENFLWKCAPPGLRPAVMHPYPPPRQSSAGWNYTAR